MNFNIHATAPWARRELSGMIARERILCVVKREIARGGATPPYRIIADELGFSRQQIKYHMKRLLDGGWLA